MGTNTLLQTSVHMQKEVCVAHSTAVTTKDFSTQPLNPQGPFTKAKKRNKAKNTFDLRWKPQYHKCFNLETDSVLRALFLRSAQNTHFQAPDIKNLGQKSTHWRASCCLPWWGTWHDTLLGTAQWQ